MGYSLEKLERNHTCLPYEHVIKNFTYMIFPHLITPISLRILTSFH